MEIIWAVNYIGKVLQVIKLIGGMKMKKNIFKKVIVGLTVGLCLINSSVLAKELEEKVCMKTRKVWTIEFNQEIDEDSVNSKTVFFEMKNDGEDNFEKYYYNSQNNYKIEGKKIKVQMAEPYTLKKDYILNIDGVKSKFGQKVGQTTMKFRLFDQQIKDDFAEENQEILNSLCDEILEEINLDQVDKDNDYGKIYLIANWIYGNVYYDFEEAENPNPYSYGRTALGTLDERHSVCEGSARGFNALAKRAGYEVKYIRGKRKRFHGWSAIEINNQWYYVDCQEGYYIRSAKSFDERGYTFENDIDCSDESFDNLAYDHSNSFEKLGLEIDEMINWTVSPSKVEMGRYRP